MLGRKERDQLELFITGSLNNSFQMSTCWRGSIVCSTCPG
jgi:hypothetical protein